MFDCLEVSSRVFHAHHSDGFFSIWGDNSWKKADFPIWRWFVVIVYLRAYPLLERYPWAHSKTGYPCVWTKRLSFLITLQIEYLFIFGKPGLYQSFLILEPPFNCASLGLRCRALILGVLVAARDSIVLIESLSSQIHAGQVFFLLRFYF